MRLFTRAKASSQPHLSRSSRFSRGQILALVTIVLAVAVLLLVVSAPLWLPQTVRRFIPDRYIVAYAPEPLIALIYGSREARLVEPTAIPVARGNDLLEDLGPSAASSPTPLPTISGVASTTEALPGGASSGPTPTVAFVPENGTPTPGPEDLPPFAELRGPVLIGQGFNMCGEATMSMYMSYWGIEVDSQTQFDISEAVKPHPDDSNTSPGELVRYAQSLGFGSIWRVDGDIYLLKRFIAAGIPVMIERGFDELPEDSWMGHYMLIVGYDEASREMAVFDSYWGLKTVHRDNTFPVNYWDYDRLDELWRHFNRAFLVMYPPERTAEVEAIIGDEMDDQTMYQNAAQHARADLLESEDDFWGWADLGASLVGLGDYERAAQAFDQVTSDRLRPQRPFRYLWYQFELYEAYYRTGQYDKVWAWTGYILDVENYPESEEAFYYRGLVLLARDDRYNAVQQFRRALHYNPFFEPACTELQKLGETCSG